MPRFSNLLIRASAGTGKTFQLSNRFLALLEAGVPPDQILAVTFTRKAAGEILDRVVTRLAAAVVDESRRKELACFIQTPDLDEAAVRRMLRDLLAHLHRVRIGTLDSFFAQIARAMLLELGLPIAWQIADEVQDAGLRTAAIEAVLHAERPTELLTLMHLLAKGETRRNVAALIRDTVGPLDDLYHDSTAAAWSQVPQPPLLGSEQLADALEDLRSAAVPGKAMESARTQNLDAAQRNDWDVFISKGLAKSVLEGRTTFGRQEIPAELAAACGKLLEQARAILLRQTAFQTEAAWSLLEKFHDAYRSAQEHQQAIQFGDVTRTLARRAVDDPTTPENEAILTHRLDGQIHHLLLDEFQDTAPSQWAVLRPLAEQAVSSDDRSLFCVGDAKQAIYGWRGGVAEIFDVLEAELQPLARQTLTSQTLAQSFRSSPPVIETVNQVFQRLSQFPGAAGHADVFAAWQEQFVAHTTARDALPGYACLETAPDKANVLTRAAELVREMARQAPHLSVGVLVRRNEMVGEMIRHLRAAGIRASEESGNSLGDSPAVRLVLAAFHLADHPGDLVARFHLARSPLAAPLELDGDAPAAAARLSQHLRRRLLVEGYGAVVEWLARRLAPACAARDQRRLEQLVELAYTYQPRATLRPHDFATFVRRQRVKDPTTDNVRVMTIHLAKGLEFDRVVLPELDIDLVGPAAAFVVERPDPGRPIELVCRYVNAQIQQLLPPRFQRMFEAAHGRVVRESLCLLYVALTRAIHELRMIIPPAETDSIHQKFSGVLRATLTDGQAPAHTVLYQVGDPNWFHNVARPPADATSGPDAIPPTVQSAVQTTVPRLIRLRSIEQRRRGLERVSPSSLEGGRRARLIDLEGDANAIGKLRGTIIHRWFEQIEWLDQHTPADDELLTAAADLGAELEPLGVSLAAVLRDFRKMLASDAVAAVLRRSYYAGAAAGRIGALAHRRSAPTLRVQRERGFAIVADGRLLNGTIDRLVLVHDGATLTAADVIDFKTDTLTDANRSAKRRYYEPQLAAYRRAVAAFMQLPIERVFTRLVLVGAGEVWELNAAN